jgi:site-specific recombinase XerD
MAQASPVKPKILDRMREKLRVLHYPWKTERSYVAWVEKFLRYHRHRNGGTWRRPTELGKAEIEQYLTYLAVDDRVSPSTQNQAFSALLFLYKYVLDIGAAGFEPTAWRISPSDRPRIAVHSLTIGRFPGTAKPRRREVGAYRTG